MVNKNDSADVGPKRTRKINETLQYDQNKITKNINHCRCNRNIPKNTPIKNRSI